MSDTLTPTVREQLHEALATHRLLQEDAINAWYTYATAKAAEESSRDKIAELSRRAVEERGL